MKNIHNLLSIDKKSKIKEMSTFNISEIGRLLWEIMYVLTVKPAEWFLIIMSFD